MYPIVVLEGPDGSGKTTLGAELTQLWDAHYMHLTYRFSDRMFTYHSAALEMAIRRAKTQPVIIDRWWPSINIYDDEFRGERSFPMAGRMLDRAGLANGIIYVLCLPSNREQHLQQFEFRKIAGGEMYDRVLPIIEAYHRWYDGNRHRVDIIQYDYFKHGRDMAGFAAKVKQRSLALNNCIPAWFAKTRQVGGNISSGHPTALIIGEKSNPKGRHQVWPFFEYARSSLWLTNVLDQAGIQEYDLVWANAIDKDGWVKSGLLKQIAQQCQPHSIIALGNTAHKAAWTAGLHNYPTYIRLPHPAYVARFQAGDPTEYLDAFKELL